MGQRAYSTNLPMTSSSAPKQEDLIEKIRETAEMDILSEVMKDYPLQKATERWDLFQKWFESSDIA